MTNRLRYHNVFAVILILVCTLQPSITHAKDQKLEEVKKSSDLLERHLTILRSEYYPFIESTFLTHLSTLFLMRLEDFRKTLIYMTDYAQTGIKQVFRNESGWSAQTSKINGNSDNFEKIAVDLFSLENKSNQLVDQANSLLSDYKEFLGAWSDRCSEDAIKYVNEIIDPDRFFSIENVDVTLPHNPFNYTIGFQVSINFDGNIGNPPDKTPNEGLVIQDSEMVIMAASALAGTIAFSTNSDFNLGQVYGAAIGSAAGHILVTFKRILFGSDAQKYADLSKKISETMQKIREVQIAGRHQLAAKSKDLIKRECETYLPEKLVDSKDRVSDLLKGYKNIALANRERLLSELVSVQQQYKNSMTYLNSEYFPKIKDSYIAQVNRHFEDKQKNDQNALVFLRDVLAPKMVNLNKMTLSPEKLGTQHEIWNLLLRANLEFLPPEVATASLTDSTSPSGRKQLPSLWEKIYQEISKKMGLL